MPAFNKYFQDELAYLREVSREFSRAYPALAPMLAERGADPDVERILEGVAFLTGRIRQKLDDELPELVHSVARLLDPQLLRPVPCATILHIEPLPNVLRAPTVVGQGTEFASVDVDGTPCRFSAAMDCRLVPWVLDAVRIEPVASGRQVLRVELRSSAGIPIRQLATDELRIHLAGELRPALATLAWLVEHTRNVSLADPAAAGGAEPRVSLGKGALRAGGFSEAESLFPRAPTSFPGFRLLAEYHVLAAKFAFVDIVGLSAVAELDPKLTRLSVLVELDAPPPPDAVISTDTYRLHCLPVVNVFETTAEPVHPDLRRKEHLVRPAGLPGQHAEVYAITSVTGMARGTSARVEIPSFYEFSHVAGARGQAPCFYDTHVRPSALGEGADVSISLSAPPGADRVPSFDALSLDLLATNRGLGGALRPGEIRVATPSSPPFVTFRNLTPPSTYVPPPLGRELAWRTVAHASMGLRSATDVRVLRTLLTVHNPTATVDRQAARANELRVGAIHDVRVSPAERLYRGAPIRGVRIELEVDEEGFSGEGDLHLLGAVLERFFAAYVSINSFTQTSVVGRRSRVRFSWPARSGTLTLS